MRILNLIKYILGVLSVVLIFVSWKLAIALFLIASIVHVFPAGPNHLLSVITGYLVIGGVIYLFINWKFGVGLILCGYLVAKFRVYGNKCNYDYYGNNKRDDDH